MRADADSDARAFVTSRALALYRTAYLIVGDQHRAEELTTATLVQLVGAWGPARRAGPERYARRRLVRLIARRPGRASQGCTDPFMCALQSLPLRTRADLVLRYHDDVPDRDVADVLGTSTWWLARQRRHALAELTQLLPPSGCVDVGTAIAGHFQLTAPSTGPVVDWSELQLRSQSRRRVRRSAAAAVALALAATVSVVSPWRSDSPGGYTPGLPNGPDLPAPPSQALVLDANGCPPGRPVVQTVDEAGETALVQTVAGTWACSSAASSPGGPMNYFSSAWSDVEIEGDDGAWLGPLTLDACSGAPCGSVLWSAVSALPPNVSAVTVRVEGEDGAHDATESESTWAVRLSRPASDNVVVSTRHTIVDHTLQITVRFGHSDPPPGAEATFTAVDAPIRAACKESLAGTAFPAWSQTSCSNELLQRNLGHTGGDLAFSLRLAAQCQWLAEYLVASDRGEAARAASALGVIAEIPSWPGFDGNALGTYVAMLGRQASGGDVVPMRQQFPNSPGAAANCSADDLVQAGSWSGPPG